MSVKIAGQVWELEMDAADKLVLLALADHADHEGNNVRPGNDLLCAKTGLSQQTISAKITKFIKAGVLIPANSQTGRGHKRLFSIDLDGVPRTPYFVNRARKKVQVTDTFEEKKAQIADTFKTQKVQADKGERYKLTEEKVQFDNSRHDKERARVLTVIEPSIEPSIGAASLAQPATAEIFPAQSNSNHLASEEIPATKDHPAIKFIRSLTNRYPDKSLWPKIALTLGAGFDSNRVGECYREWVGRGFNKMNFAWLFDWYVSGIPASKGVVTSRHMADVAMIADMPAWRRQQFGLE